jgi:hypothetical protein
MNAVSPIPMLRCVREAVRIISNEMMESFASAKVAT